METYDAIDVAVRGGDLRVGRWAGEGTPLLAVHGVTANHRTWSAVARATSAPVLAPDLRGRGRSGDLPGPAGMDRHVTDLLAVLDHLELERVVVAGHSMGGFVATALAAAHPDRVAGVLLVDGGLPLPDPPAGVSPEQVVSAMIGPAAERLGRTFASTEDYLDFWGHHPALAPHWSADVEDYLSYDLTGEPPSRRSSVSLAAVTDDSADLLDRDVVDARVRSLPPVSLFLRAPAGLMAEPAGLYPTGLMAEHAAAYPGLELREVPDVNHYTVLLGERGAGVVGAAAEELGAGG